MDFFASQDRSLRNTKVLVVLFGLAVLAIIATIYFSFLPVYLHNAQLHGAVLDPAWLWWQPELFGYTTLCVLFIIISGSSYMMIKLSEGGSAVALMLGGRLIEPNSEDLDERKAYHVVQEMAIASGTPMPEIYILEDEPSINAFAAGFSKNDTAIGITHGAIKLLTRDELQGIIGHEFSHILNGDMRLNIRLTAILHGILCIALIGYWTMRVAGRGGRRNKAGGYIVLVGLVLWLIGYVGVIFGKLIRSAISRNREYLADASSVQFTRNPGGIANALLKIGSTAQVTRIDNPNAHAISHMFFSNALKASWFGLMSTHPPLDERIRRIDPSYRTLGAKVSSGYKPTAVPVTTPAASMGFAPAASMAVNPEQFVANVGKLNAQGLNAASQFLQEIPANLQQALYDTYKAQAAIFCILLDKQEAVRQKQFELLKAGADPLVLNHLTDLEPQLQSLGQDKRLPIVDLTVPALRRMSPEQYKRFKQNIGSLIHADGRLTLFEYILEKVLTQHLAPSFEKVDRQNVHYRFLAPITDDAILVLSTLAQAGTKDSQQAEQAFLKGLKFLTHTPHQLLSTKELNLKALDRSFQKLAHASPSLKRDILQAAVAVVGFDGQVTPREAEMLRAVGDSLGCPVPPIAIH